METIRTSAFGTDASVALVIPGYEPYKIPKNWCWVEMSSISDFERGITFPVSAKEIKKTSKNIACLRTANVQETLETNDLLYVNTSFLKDNPKKIVREKDILMSIANSKELVGKTSFVKSLDESMTFGGFIMAIRSRINPEYLFYYLRLLFYKGEFINSSTQTTNIANINSKALGQNKIPLAPLPEQLRIVERIEKLFSKLDEAKEKAQEILDSFNMRKASILNNAFSGKLTEKWRKEHKIGLDSWKNSSLISLSEKIFDGPFGSNLKSEDYVDSGIRVVRLENLKNLWFDDSKQSFITKQKYDTIKKHTVFPSDLIMSTFIADEIKVCQMPSYVKFAVNKADCIGIRLKDNVNKKYVLYYLSSKIVFNLLIKQIHGATRPRVNSKQIKSINIFIPTIEEQNEIVESLDKFINNENKSKESAEMVIDQIDLMKKSILSKAFRGELGTNNPNDENAEELLKRILSEKAKEANEQPKVKRTRIVIPEEIENLLQTNLEREIIKLFYKSETKEVPEEDVMSVSSRAFDNLDAVQFLEEKKLIKKSKDGIYKLLR